MTASSSQRPDLDLTSRLRRGPVAGTFQDPRDRSVTNQDAWLALLEAVQARDVAAIAERLPRAKGTVVPRTRTGQVRKGRLPFRVDALLEASPAFAAYQRSLARLDQNAPSGSMLDTDDSATDLVLNWARSVSALDLLHWAAPDLVAPVIRWAAAQDRQAPDEQWWYHNPLAGWLTPNGETLPAIEHGSTTGDGSWNPRWPEVAVALTIGALDRVGRDRFRDALDREAGRCVTTGGDNAEVAWLQRRTCDRLTREDAQALQDRQRSFAHRIAQPADEDLPRVWDRALAEIQQEANAQSWDRAAWSAWARRWMLACDRLLFPEGVAATAQAFWQRWPEARLPLRRDDSVSPNALLGNATVFTDQRLIDWLMHGEGTFARPAQRQGGRWFTADGYADRLDRHPWTWLEWALDFGRMGVAQPLVSQGMTLYEGFETVYLPEQAPWVLTRQAQTAWLALQAERQKQVDVLRLTEEACRAQPTPSVRARHRL